MEKKNEDYIVLNFQINETATILYILTILHD